MIEGSNYIAHPTKDARVDIMRVDHLNLRRRLIYATKGLEDLKRMLRSDTPAGRKVRDVLRHLADEELAIIGPDVE